MTDRPPRLFNEPTTLLWPWLLTVCCPVIQRAIVVQLVGAWRPLPLT